MPLFSREGGIQVKRLSRGCHGQGRFSLCAILPSGGAISQFPINSREVAPSPPLLLFHPRSSVLQVTHLLQWSALMHQDDFMTFRETMAYLRISRSTLWRLMTGKGLTAYKVGSTWRFSRAEVNAYVRQHAYSTLAEPPALSYT